MIDKELMQKMKLSNIGKRFWISNLQFIEDKKALKKVNEYIKNIPDNIKNGNGLFFIGKYGNGKTSLTICIAKEFFKIKKSVYFLPSFELNDVFFEKNKKLYNEIKDIDLLILDDIGAQHNNNFTNFIFESLVRHRYNHMKINIYTTNNIYVLQDLANGGLIDIIKQTCNSIQMEDNNYRNRS